MMDVSFGLFISVINVYVIYVCYKMYIKDNSVIHLSFIIANVIAFLTGIVFNFVPDANDLWVYFGRYADRINMGIAFTCMYLKDKYPKSHFFC